MSFLRPFYRGGEGAGAWGNKLRAISINDEFPGFGYSGASHSGGISAHIGDKPYAAFIAYR
ncbi:hypothetical protein ES703_119219 [subsurface metagenome]